MKLFNFYIDEETRKEVNKVAEKHLASKSKIIRRALMLYLEKVKRNEREGIPELP